MRAKPREPDPRQITVYAKVRWATPGQDCRRHGRRRQAYMDVFTACPEREWPAGPPAQLREAP